MKAPRILLLLAALLPAACSFTPTVSPERAAYLEKVKQANALYEEKCRTVAGIKVYKTVPDVDGLLLMKLRLSRTDRELADPMWPGAVFGREGFGDGFINSFLGSEIAVWGEISVQKRGQIALENRPGSLPGYRWVEAIDPKDGQRYRYTGATKATRKKDTTAPGVQRELQKNPDYDLNVYTWVLDKTPSPSKPPPRYGVTWDDHVIPEERALGIASSTVKVLDLSTQEVLGEMTIYANSFIPTERARDLPWLTRHTCGGPAGGASTFTRQFVDQVLIPRKEQ